MRRMITCSTLCMLCIGLLADLSAESHEHHKNHQQHQNHQNYHGHNSPAQVTESVPPFLNLHAGREGYLHASHPVNEDRLYDFYDRQAKYYKHQKTLPPVLTGYPGLEGGVHGHWGKGSKSNHEDDGWNRMDIGHVFAGSIGLKTGKVMKAVAVKLGKSGNLTCVFDPESASIREVWQGGIQFKGKRFGLVGGVLKEGYTRFWSEGAIKPESYQYLGYYRHGERVVFKYKLGETQVLDSPWGQGGIFTRNLSLVQSLPSHQLDVLQLDGKVQLEIDDAAQTALISHAGKLYFAQLRGNQGGRVKFSIVDRQVRIKPKSEQTRTVSSLVLDLKEIPSGPLQLVVWAGKQPAFERVKQQIARLPIENPAALTKGGKALWPATFKVKGELDRRELPYVIDTIPVPHDNPYKSMMFIGDHDFFANGDAAVCTIMGDVWRVSGIDHELAEVTWRRIATGLHQPLGLVVADDVIHVLGKDQITRLHDLNHDGEMDYYECYSNSYRTSRGGHDYATGLGRDDAGNFYFVTGGDGAIKVRPGGSSEIIARGIRNPNGVGVRSDGLMTTAPQEGTWAPTTSIIEVSPGEFYGFRAKTGDEIDPPLCFVPRGVDASAGGQVFVDSEKWGPLNKQLLGMSYGFSTHYMVLRDVVDGIAQGAIVPLYSEFLSGSHRARFHPIDGQLYVSGADGWGNYAQQSGCFQRVRYTGKPIQVPVAFEPYANGLKITFTNELDPTSVKDIKQYLVQQWNYIMSESYGSAEYSVKMPNMPGHDKVEVASAHLLSDKKTIFLELPAIIPVMQMHIHGELKTAKGEAFTFNLFPTLKKLRPAYEFKGMQPLKDKALDLKMRINWTKKTQPSGVGIPGREIIVKAIQGLKYSTTEIKAKPGERLSLTLVNADQMQHNLVIVKPGMLQKVGMAAIKMVNHPDAFSMSYTPKMPEVIAKLPVVSPGERYVFNMNAPKQSGKYPFLCTFPGHWNVMNGVLVVE